MGRMKGYDIPHEEWVRILAEIVDEETPSDLMVEVEGVYELLSEHFNNAVIERWAREQGLR